MKKNYNKDRNWEILCFCLAFIYLFFTINNFIKLDHLEKHGIIENVIVKSYSIKKSYSRAGSNYHTIIEYSLIGENIIQICTFNFKPNDEYFENKKIQIIRDPKNDFKLPINEKEAFRRVKIIGNIIWLFWILLIILITRCLNYIFEKNRNKNKQIKKLIKKNPELKEKYKKEENVKTTILLILLLPFILIDYFIKEIKDKIKKKKSK